MPIREARVRTLTFAVTFGLVLFAVVSSPVGAQDPAEQSRLVSEGVRAREEFGLSANPDTVGQLIGSVDDVGSKEWGIPLTAAEAQKLDIGGRMKYEGEFDETVVPFVRALVTYAGVSFDQRDGGRPTVWLTQLDEGTVAAIRALDPDPTRGLRIEVAETSYASLVAAAEEGEAALRALDSDAALNGVGVDVLGNRVSFYVGPGYVVDASITSRLQRAIGTDVAFVAEAIGSDTVCNARNNCANPMKAGVRIDRDFLGSSWWCTMGFVVSAGADEQVLTAGHCGWGGPQDWYHGGFGVAAVSNEIGDNANGTLYAQGGKDVMRMTFPDAQASRQIYFEGGVVEMKASATPLVGQAISFSGAKTDAIVTGTVTSAWRSWVSTTANPDFTVWGGDASWTTDFGDSGAPVYRKVFVTNPIPGWQVTPIGINSHQNGYFARVFDATIAWNLTMYNQ